MQSLLGLPSGTRVWLAAGMSGLAGIAQVALNATPFEGHVFVFRGKRGDLVKLLWRYLLGAVGMIFLWVCFFEPPYQPASIELDGLSELIEQPKPPEPPENQHQASNKNTLSLLKSGK
jgi:hypothetical protein